MPDNQRLIQGRRLEKIRTKLGMSQTELGKYLKIPQSYVSQLEKGVKSISNNIITRLAQRFPQVNIGWLLTGIPDDDNCAFIVQNTGNPRQDGGDLVQVTSMYTYENANILIPVAAQAGYAHAWPDENLDEQISIVKIPGISGAARTVEVKGDSMIPVLEPGDWVVSRPMHDPFAVKEGRIYVVVSRSIGLTIKYLSISEDGFTCSSANRLTYDPFIIPFEDVRELWEVNLRITEHLWQSQIAFNNPAQEERIRRLELFISKQFPNFE